MGNRIYKIFFFRMEPAGSQGMIMAQYNPKEVSFTKSVNWTSESGNGTDYPFLSFGSGQAITISLELLFDKYESSDPDVRPAINALLDLTYVDPELKRPPMVQIRWGAHPDVLFKGGFKGVVKDVTTKYTMFTREGIPCRAVATVSFIQADKIQNGKKEGDEEGKQVEVPEKGTLVYATVRAGMSPDEWRTVANALPETDDPMSPSATTVTVPSSGAKKSDPNEARSNAIINGSR